MSDIKDYLKSYLELNKEINQKLDEMTRTKSMAEKTTSVLSDMPKGGGQTREDIYIKLHEMELDIDKYIDRYVDLKHEIEHYINKLDKPLYRSVIRYKYISGLSFQKIAFNINYEIRQVQRIHGYALEELRKYYNVM